MKDRYRERKRNRDRKGKKEWIKGKWVHGSEPVRLLSSVTACIPVPRHTQIYKLCLTQTYSDLTDTDTHTQTHTHTHPHTHKYTHADTHNQGNHVALVFTADNLPQT